MPLIVCARITVLKVLRRHIGHSFLHYAFDPKHVRVELLA